MSDPLSREQVEHHVLEAKRAITCLFVAVDASVAIDVRSKCYTALAELENESAALRKQLATVTEERDEQQVRHANQKKSIERYQQQLATAQDRIEEQALRLTLAVDPDDPILIIPKAAQP